jgi:hypothetical protein
MYEVFDLPVKHRGHEILFPAQLVQAGYMHKFKVTVGDTEVLFEPDEEGTYRALIEPEKIGKDFTSDLLADIAASIEKVLR